MVQRGGPAAINGFLYQILSHLGWLASVRITGRISTTDLPDEACIILEPKDGGDARLEGHGVYLVEQYKVRPDSTWAVRAIVEDVLPDLRTAVPEPPLTNGRYRFVTDGRKGRLTTFEAFLEAVRGISDPADLDATEPHHFGENLPNTFRELFDHIVKVTRRVSERERKDETATVLDLLKKFEMEFDASPDRCSDLIETMIRPICANLGDEVAKRQQLVGMLMERLSTGEKYLSAADIDELLRGAGLDPDRLRNLAKLNQTLASVLDDKLGGIHYRADMDVREPAEWPTDAPVLLIAGESGEGKTWQLAKLAQTQADARQPIVWVSPGRDAETTLARAIRVVWQEGLGATDEKSPGALTSHYCAMAPDAPLPWLTIAVDDVQDVDLARDLITQPWKRWGMRLVMSVPASVASMAQNAVSDVRVHRVCWFSVSEINDFLARKGRNWGELPSDLQQLLRTPILAGLYLQLPYDTFRTAPNCEYEIFDAFWRRMQFRTKAGDDGILIAIAIRVLEGASYPVERNHWREVSLDPDAVERLRASGWLNCLPGGLTSFAHDRLLNWAVAVFLAQQMSAGKLTAEQMVETLLKCVDGFSNNFAKRLGYVPMDLLWLLAGNGTRADVLADLIARLEASPHYGSYGQDLYTHLLPTLGERVVDALKVRFDQLPARDYRVKLVTHALSVIATQDGVDLSSLAEQLLRSPSAERQSVGISLVTAKSSARFLDRLWELHQERCEVLDCTHQELENCRWNHRDYDASFAALRAAVQADPGWLRQRIRNADPKQERVNQLAYLLNNLDYSAARDIWFDVKDDLITKVPPGRPRSLIYCVGRFGDLSLMDFLLSCLTRQEDWANSAALSNLVRLAPEQAIEKLPEIYHPELASSRNWWLPQMLNARPDETHRKLLAMAHTEARGTHIIDELFTDRADQLDVSMLRFRLRALEVELKGGAASAREGHPWLTFPLRLLNRISRPDLLAVLREEAGGQLEHMVEEVACARVKHSKNHLDHVLEPCRQFLINVGGIGITRLVNHELRSADYWGRLGGLEWAIVSPDRETIDLLRAIGRRPVTFDGKGTPNSNEWQERYKATIALAAAGSDEGVVESIWGDGPEAVAADLEELRAESGPMSKAQTSHAFEVLSAPEAEEEGLLKALTVAWLSRDTEFILPVRQILSTFPPDSRIVGMACIALHRLGDKSSDFRQQALLLLRTEKNGRWALDALLSMGDAAVPDLAAHLRDLPFEKWTNLEIALVAEFHHHEETRADAIQWAVRLCKERPRNCPLLEIAAESGDGEIRELIIQQAFHENGIVVGEKTQAINALAKFDIERAAQAAERQLRITRNELRPLAQLLARLSPHDASSRLIGIAQQRQDSLAAVGHALRRLGAEQVDRTLATCMTDPSRAIRAIGAELAGWLPPGRLDAAIESMLRDETEDNPRRVALEALDRKNQQTVALDLLRSFETAPNDRRWSILLALLQMAAPHLLTDRDDALWIAPALDKAPHIFRRHAEGALKKRKSS
ncbi:hypothetical protein AruPA_17715 [Acidiphilium sp. PA]|uniref:hypothetical protein n=1 Tax=Acidiphilium sp. PA TaxID=2871705 RepID=UPI00224351C4|nr:hypothetical protein [Acidiphilium sp. PA]MCW8308874.1 hypothetical protein [Acidiphilium sp. PA]